MENIILPSDTMINIHYNISNTSTLEIIYESSISPIKLTLAMVHGKHESKLPFFRIIQTGSLTVKGIFDTSHALDGTIDFVVMIDDLFEESYRWLATLATPVTGSSTTRKTEIVFNFDI